MTYVYAADDHVLSFTDVVDTDFHSHLFYQISISLDSGFEIGIEGKSFMCKGIIINSKVRHRFSGINGKQLFVLIDNTSQTAGMIKRIFLEDKTFSIIPDEVVMSVYSILIHEYRMAVDKTNYFEVLGKLFGALGIPFTDSTIKDGRVGKVIDILKACEGSEHSVEMLAQSVYLSASRFSHLFKENTGVALSSYIVFHKLQKAMFLIFEKMAITEASLRTGFDSPSHFAAVSKRVLGMSARDLSKDSVFLKVSQK